MAMSTRTWSIVGSLSISLILIVGAYVLSAPWFGTFHVGAQDAQALLQTYAEKDTDGDGLFDWQETLYRTDPTNAHSVDAVLTDLQAVEQGLVEPRFKSEEKELPDSFYQITDKVAAPDSITDQFSRQFLEKYLTGRGAQTPSADALQSFVQDAAHDLEGTVLGGSAFLSSSVLVRGNTPTDVSAYMLELNDIFYENKPGIDSVDVFEHFANYVERDDISSLERVREVSRAYTITAQEIMLVRAPLSARNAHLRVANAYARFGLVLKHMGTMDTDPLLGFVGATHYLESRDEVKESMLNFSATMVEIMNAQ